MVIFIEFTPWALSGFTILTMFMAGNMARYTWSVALAGQVIWLVWIIASETWGLLPGHFALWIVYIRNHLKWRSPPQPIGD